MAQAVWTAVEAYLRPGELWALRVEDLGAPTGSSQKGLDVWTLTVAPAERQEVSKTGTMDDTVRLDQSEWLGPLLANRTAYLDGKEFLFDIPLHARVAKWKAACSRVGLVAEMYQLRHSGASGDMLSGRLTVPQIMARGRWISDKSVRRYAKAGAVQKALRRVPRVTQRYGQQVLDRIQEVLSGNLILNPPPASVRSVVSVVR